MEKHKEKQGCPPPTRRIPQPRRGSESEGPEQGASGPAFGRSRKKQGGLSWSHRGAEAPPPPGQAWREGGMGVRDHGYGLPFEW